MGLGFRELGFRDLGFRDLEVQFRGLGFYGADEMTGLVTSVKVEPRKLAHHSPHALKVKGIPALIILNPCANFLGFTNYRVWRSGFSVACSRRFEDAGIYAIGFRV